MESQTGDAGRNRGQTAPLRDCLLARIEHLTNSQSLDLAEHAEQFPEVIEAFTIDGATPHLVDRDEDGKLISKASLEDGGSLVVTGFLASDAGDYVGSFKRRLQFAPGWALHERLWLEPAFRGRGIAPRFLRRSFQL